MMVIHPNQVTAANAIFSPDAPAVAAAEAVISALEVAQASGDGAVRHDGRMIDSAMLETARRVLADHRATIGRSAGAPVTTGLAANRPADGGAR